MQIRFGHSSIQQTYDRYGHLFPQMDEAIADDRDEAYRTRRNAEPGEPSPAQIGGAGLTAASASCPGDTAAGSQATPSA